MYLNKSVAKARKVTSFHSIFVLYPSHAVGLKKLSAALQSEGSRNRQPEANTNVVLTCTEMESNERQHTYAQEASCFSGSAEQWREVTSNMMKGRQEITPAKRKRLLKTFGLCLACYTVNFGMKLVESASSSWSNQASRLLERSFHWLIMSVFGHCERKKQGENHQGNSIKTTRLL
jgi:hypothetical protein